MGPVHELEEPDSSLAGLGDSLQDSVTLAKMGDARDGGPGPSGRCPFTEHTGSLVGRVASSDSLTLGPLLFDFFACPL